MSLVGALLSHFNIIVRWLAVLLGLFIIARPYLSAARLSMSNKNIN